MQALSWLLSARLYICQFLSVCLAIRLISDSFSSQGYMFISVRRSVLSLFARVRQTSKYISPHLLISLSLFPHQQSSGKHLAPKHFANYKDSYLKDL